jgi:hypothetical protein
MFSRTESGFRGASCEQSEDQQREDTIVVMEPVQISPAAALKPCVRSGAILDHILPQAAQFL